MVAPLADQRFAQAGQIAQIAHRARWHETGAQQTTFEQLRQPLTVSDVGLAARHHLDVPRVHEDQAHGVL